MIFLSIAMRYFVFFAVGTGLLVIADLNLPEFYSHMLMGKGVDGYPWTMQNFMWLVFFFGLGDVFRRFEEFNISRQHFGLDYLALKEKKFLSFDDLDTIYNNAKMVSERSQAYLPRMIKQVVEQLRTTRSLDNAVAVLNSFLDILAHQLDLRYGRIRYLVWLTPTLGFLGTVFGISATVAVVGKANPEDPMLLANMAGKLALAFDTTILSLIQSAILLFLVHIVERNEETELNKAGEYILENLINRIK